MLEHNPLSISNHFRHMYLSIQKLCTYAYLGGHQDLTAFSKAIPTYRVNTNYTYYREITAQNQR